MTRLKFSLKMEGHAKVNQTERNTAMCGMFTCHHAVILIHLDVFIANNKNKN